MAKKVTILVTPHTVLLEGGLRVTFPPGTRVEWDSEIEGLKEGTAREGAAGEPVTSTDETMSRAIARSLENHG